MLMTNLPPQGVPPTEAQPDQEPVNPDDDAAELAAEQVNAEYVEPSHEGEHHHGGVDESS